MLGVRLLLINTHYNPARGNQKVAGTGGSHVALVLREAEGKIGALRLSEAAGWGGGGDSCDIKR